MLYNPYKNWLIPYLEGSLDPKQVKKLEDRLESDHELAAELNELRMVIHRIQHASSSTEQSNEGLYYSIWPKVQQQISNTKQERSNSYQLALAGAAVIWLAVIAIMPSGHNLSSPDKVSAGKQTFGTHIASIKTNTSNDISKNPSNVANKLNDLSDSNIFTAPNTSGTDIDDKTYAEFDDPKSDIDDKKNSVEDRTLPVVPTVSVFMSPNGVKTIKPVLSAGNVKPYASTANNLRNSVMIANNTNILPLDNKHIRSNYAISNSGYHANAFSLPAITDPTIVTPAVTMGSTRTAALPGELRPALTNPGSGDNIIVTPANKVSFLCNEALQFLHENNLEEALDAWRDAVIVSLRDGKDLDSTSSNVINILNSVRVSGYLMQFRARIESESRQHPDEPDAWRILGYIYFTQGQPQLSINAWKHVVQGNSPTADDLYQLGYTAEQTRETSIAIDAYRKFLAMATMLNNNAIPANSLRIRHASEYVAANR